MQLRELPLEKFKELEAANICLDNEARDLRLKLEKEAGERLAVERELRGKTASLGSTAEELSACRRRLLDVGEELQSSKQVVSP